MKEGVQGYRRHESKESPELFRGTLGFDFVFERQPDGSKRPICIEINGQESGIAGVQNIPRDQIDELTRTMAGIRARENDEHRRKNVIRRDVLIDIDEGVFTPSAEARKDIEKYLDQSLDKERFMEHANVNPPEIEELTEDKNRQQEYIPEDARAYTYVSKADFETVPSKSGFVVVKPNSGRGGRGISVLSVDELAQNLEEWQSPLSRDGIVKNVLRTMQIQEFILPAGADNAPADAKDNPASLRLLIDFIYREDGTVDPTYVMGYQRISKRSLEDALTYPAIRDNALVVNKSRGAGAVAASSEELNAAREVGMRIIQNVGRAYTKGQLKQFDDDVRLAS